MSASLREQEPQRGIIALNVDNQSGLGVVFYIGRQAARLREGRVDRRLFFNKQLGVIASLSGADFKSDFHSPKPKMLCSLCK